MAKQAMLFYSPQHGFLSVSCNHFHNILRLFDVLTKFVKRCAIITYIRVASRVAERLKIWDLRKLGNIRKVSKLQKLIV